MSEISQIAREAQKFILLTVIIEKQWPICNDKQSSDLDHAIRKVLKEYPEAVNFFTIKDWCHVLDKTEGEVEEFLELPQWQRKSHTEKIKSIMKSRRKVVEKEINESS